MEAAEEAALVDRGVRTEGPPVDVIQLDLAGRAADAAIFQRPRAAPVVTLPCGAPDRGGDVAGTWRLRFVEGGSGDFARGFAPMPRRFA